MKKNQQIRVKYFKIWVGSVDSDRLFQIKNDKINRDADESPSRCLVRVKFSVIK